MSTFWTLYIVALVLNLVVVRVCIHQKIWKPSPGWMFVTFFPGFNILCAIAFTVVGIFAALYWVVNGTLECED